MPHDPAYRLHGDRFHVAWWIRVPWRYFVTGYPIRGGGDNASFLHHATEDYRGKPVQKYTRRRWERVVRRWVALVVPFWLLLAAPWVGMWPVATWLVALVLAGAGWSGRSSWRRLSARRTNREWVDPAAKVLCGLVGKRYTKAAGRRMIELPPGWGRNAGARNERVAVRVSIPEGTALSPQLKGRITGQVGARLGIPEAQGEWQEAGAHVQVAISAVPLPPEEVTWSEMARPIAEAKETEVVVGRKAGGHLVKVSLVEDAPHFLMSGSSGTGKSVLARVFMVQRMMIGDGVIILDPKRFSHWRWAGGGKLGTDRLIYAYRDEDLYETWVAIGQEIARRIELPEDELALQRRVLVMGEELNVQTKKLTRHWKAKRKEIMIAAKMAMADDADYDPADLDPPLQSPAIVAMQELVCMGRELRMHMIAAAQRASAGIFGGGGGDIRESFQGGRFIAKWDRPLWKMLVNSIAYVAWPGGKAGIWGLSRPSGFEIFRVPWLTEDDALKTVLSSGPVSGPVLGQQNGRPTVDSETVRPALVQAVKLSDAWTLLPGHPSLDVVRRASTRDKSFPEPVGQDGAAKLYDLSALIYWADRRILA